MQRRQFIALVGSAAAWPLAVRAKQSAAQIGFLAGGSKDGSVALVDELKHGLTQNGMMEGQDYILESYWAEGDYGRFPSFARELVAKQPHVIVGNTIAAVKAAQHATTVIPIVMMGINDPVGTGIVNSLARPGGNTTGMATLNQDSGTKLLQYLRALLPKAEDVAVILNPGNPSNLSMLKSLEEISPPVGVSLRSFEVGTLAMLEVAFASILRKKPDAILVIPDAATGSLKSIATKGLDHRIPVVSSSAVLTAAGGLISYGLSPSEIPRRTAYFVRKVIEASQPSGRAADAADTHTEL